MRPHVRLERIDGSGSLTASIFVAATICGFARELVVEERELALDGLEIFDRIPARCARHVHEVDQHLRAIEMLQEPIAESLAFVRALDEPGHVGDDEAAIAAQRDDAEIRDERRERVVGDLGSRRGNARDQRRFAGVRKSDEADVGEQLEVELQLLGFARRAFFEPPRRAVGRADEARVAASADAALREEHALSGFDEVADENRVVPGSAGFS